MSFGTDLADKWRDWLEQRGNSGVLRINSTDTLPPGLREALQFERFEVFFSDHQDPSIAVDQGDRIEVRVNAGLVAPTTLEAGTIRRVIRTGERVHHELFSLPKTYWGQGNARAMLRAAVDLYDALGIEEVTLTAQGLGKYIWAVAGFDFCDDQTRELVNTALRLFADELGVLDEPLPEFQHPWEILALDKDDEGKEINIPATLLAPILADRGETRLIQGFRPGSLTPSKAFLIYAGYDSWDGRLSLHPRSPSRSQLEAYLAGLR